MKQNKVIITPGNKQPEARGISGVSVRQRLIAELSILSQSLSMSSSPLLPFMKENDGMAVGSN